MVETMNNGRLSGTRAFDTSPAEVARRIILRFGEDLLVVAPPQGSTDVYSTGYVLGDNGIWHAGGDPWVRRLVEIADVMTHDAVLYGLDGRALSAAVTAINRIKRPGVVDQVRPMLRAMLDLLRRDGEPCQDVTECVAEDLDANLRYLGTRSGVVDLATGSLLPTRGRTQGAGDHHGPYGVQFHRPPSYR